MYSIGNGAAARENADAAEHEYPYEAPPYTSPEGRRGLTRHARGRSAQRTPVRHWLGSGSGDDQGQDKCEGQGWGSRLAVGVQVRVGVGKGQSVGGGEG